MKLSMWMLANRLSPLLDIKTEIRWDAPAVLNSARLVYATNCVHAYEEKDHIVCDGEGDRIYLYGIDLKEAFETIQGIFDYFSDWEEQAEQYIASGQYQKLVDSCFLFFDNPLILMDANYHILGMSQNPEIGTMDEEWTYMKTYGYSSLNSLRNIAYQNTHIDFTHSGCQIYHLRSDRKMLYGGASYNLMFDGLTYGRLTLLEKLRALNTGDFQLLQKLGSKLAPALGTGRQSHHAGGQVFANLLLNRAWNEADLSLQLLYYGWKAEDIYQLCTIQFTDESAGTAAVNLLAGAIQSQSLNFALIRHGDTLSLLAARELDIDDSFMTFIRTLTESNPIRVSFSLALPSLTQAPVLLSQARQALRYGGVYHPGRRIYLFRDYSTAFLLNSNDSAGKLHACHPKIVELWQKKIQENNPLFDTLLHYLESERSLNKTAAELFTHKNTVQYRIRKIKEILHDDLENPDTRFYILISMHYLQIQEIKDRQGEVFDK
ncbi:MAG: PucR family transcriptional regulator [Bilifractor sp.]